MKTTLTLIAISCLMSACVTINIYFPAAAAEKAADKVIDEVWQINKENQGSGQTDAQQTVGPAEKKSQSTDTNTEFK